MERAKIRKIVTITEDTLTEMGRDIPPPTRRAAAVAVIQNPFAGRYVEDLEPLMEIGAELGGLLGDKAVAALGITPAEAQSYGKAALVGENGELEHAAAILHPKLGAPLRVAVEEAHAQDAEILICLRAAGWKGAPPWEEFFMSEFYEAHPEWRCVDYDGTPTMHMSYAAEEVQDHLLDVYREVLQRDPDGAGFMFHRGMPMMLWEEPFCKRFVQKFGEDPRKLAEDDPRVFEMRAEIVTSFMRKIRTLLDETAKKQGRADHRLKLAVTTFATAADNRKFGIDVETWIEEKLVDQIGIAWFAYYTSGLKTKSGDTAYYARITEGTDVKTYPFYVGWKMNSASDLLSKVAVNYDDGADGIAVWDPNQFVGWQSGKNPYWPLISKLGHRQNVRAGSLLYKPIATPLTRLGNNHYSRWHPNTGF